MSYESRAYDNEHGDPVVVLVVTGTHDVSRLVNTLAGGQPVLEQVTVGRKILQQVRRHAGGRAALRLLRDHGGPDFTTDPAYPEAVDIAQRRAAANLHALARAGDRLQNQRPSGCACPDESLKECGWREGVGQLLEEIRQHAGSIAAPRPDDEDLRALRLAVNDRGAFLRRKIHENERLVDWQARAVVAAGWAPIAETEVR